MQSSALKIIENIGDIIGYAHNKVNLETGESKRVLTLRSVDESIRCGGRFAYITPEIDFSYEALTKALKEEIDKEAKEHDNKFVTNEREAANVVKDYNFDELMVKFEDVVGKLMAKDQNFYQPRITQIIEKYLGKGKKISGVTRDQAELVHLIISEIEDDLLKS